MDLRWLEHGWHIYYGCFRICVCLHWKNIVVDLGKFGVISLYILGKFRIILFFVLKTVGSVFSLESPRWGHTSSLHVRKRNKTGHPCGAFWPGALMTAHWLMNAHWLGRPLCWTYAIGIYVGIFVNQYLSSIAIKRTKICPWQSNFDDLQINACLNTNKLKWICAKIMLFHDRYKG